MRNSAKLIFRPEVRTRAFLTGRKTVGHEVSFPLVRCKTHASPRSSHLVRTWDVSNSQSSHATFDAPLEQSRFPRLRLKSQPERMISRPLLRHLQVPLAHNKTATPADKSSASHRELVAAGVNYRCLYNWRSRTKSFGKPAKVRFQRSASSDRTRDGRFMLVWLT